MPIVRKINEPLEKDIRNQVRSVLQYSGWFVVLHFNGPLSYKGFSDLTAIKDGRTVYIEIKRKGGKQSDDQIKFEKDIKDHGGEYILAYSTDDVAHLCDRLLF